MMYQLTNQDAVQPYQEIEDVVDGQRCVVCLSSKVQVVFFKCSHAVCCVECALRLRECPVCRKDIDRIAKVYFS
jgi:hypothetical protein